MVIGIVSLAILIVGLILLALGYNEAFYSDNSTIRAIFTVITNFGDPLVFIIIAAIFYITYDKKFAKNLALGLVCSSYFNSLIKNVFQDPRPPTNVNPSKEYGLVETSYGFPSGHSQTAVAFWGYMAYEFKNKVKANIIPIFFSILIFLVAISRMIIGVHDLQDVVGGLTIGIGFLLVFIYLEPIISEKTRELSLNVKILLIVAISIFLLLLGTLLFPSNGLSLVPAAPIFTDTGGFSQSSGVILGLGVGYLIENKYVDYQPSELDVKLKILNLIVGMVIIFVAYFALEAIRDVFNSFLYRYVRYALISFILSCLLPLIFKKINGTNPKK